MLVSDLTILCMFLRVLIFACLGSGLVVAGFGVKADQTDKKKNHFVLAAILIAGAIIGYLALRVLK